MGAGKPHAKLEGGREEGRKRGEGEKEREKEGGSEEGRKGRRERMVRSR